jgi:hypothetical protein
MGRLKWKLITTTNDKKAAQQNRRTTHESNRPMDHLPHSFPGQSQTTYHQPPIHRRSRPPALRAQRRLPRRDLRRCSSHRSSPDLRGHLRPSDVRFPGGIVAGRVIDFRIIDFGPEKTSRFCDHRTAESSAIPQCSEPAARSSQPHISTSSHPKISAIRSQRSKLLFSFSPSGREFNIHDRYSSASGPTQLRTFSFRLGRTRARRDPGSSFGQVRIRASLQRCRQRARRDPGSSLGQVRIRASLQRCRQRARRDPGSSPSQVRIRASLRRCRQRARRDPGSSLGQVRIRASLRRCRQRARRDPGSSLGQVRIRASLQRCRQRARRGPRSSPSQVRIRASLQRCRQRHKAHAFRRWHCLQNLMLSPILKFCEPTMNFPCGKTIPQPRIKPVIVGDTTCSVSPLTGTISGSNFAIPYL